MNRQQWDKLSDEKKNNLIHYKYTGYKPTNLEHISWDALEKFCKQNPLSNNDKPETHILFEDGNIAGNYLGDMNLCMELVKNDPFNRPWYLHWVKPERKFHFHFYSDTMAGEPNFLAKATTPQAAICTAYALATGIITED